VQDGKALFRVFVVSARPARWTADRADILPLGRTDSGRDIWGAIEEGRVIVYGEGEAPGRIIAALTRQLYGTGVVRGSRGLEERMKELLAGRRGKRRPAASPAPPSTA
jgi:hypothetical protein